MKLETETEIAFARLALSTLEGNFLEVLKCTTLVDDLAACTTLRERRTALVAMFEAAHVLTREQLGLPALPHLRVPGVARLQ